VTLDRAEKDDPAFFFGLCGELTLEEFSTHYGHERFVTRTPGWAASDATVRRRIVAAAKRVLVAPTDKPEQARTDAFNIIDVGHMAAVWLLLEQDPDWLEGLGAQWWHRWCSYLVRELRPSLSGEPDQPKRGLLQILYRHAPLAIRDAVVQLATSTAEGSDYALSGVLDLLDAIPDEAIDRALIDAVGAKRVPEDRISRVAEFVLTRNQEAGLAAFSALLRPSSSEVSDAQAIRAAAALMTHVTPDGWNHAQTFLRERPDLARSVLGEVFYRQQFWRKRKGARVGLTSLAPRQLAELIGLLLEVYPPENDPHYDEAHWVSPDDAARQARNQLISWVGEQQTAEGVATLRYVEGRFGERYPWLRSVRVGAERRFRLAQWRPLDARTIGEILDARQERLIRSDTDALDAVVEAVGAYARRLHQDRLEDREDFWNLPKRGWPSPRDEQHASRKVAAAILDYLREYAVTADREVQIVRRLTPADAGGAPGSKPDVLCRVPAAGTVTDTPIAIPLEVKLSFNPRARSGLQDQLAGRYIPQTAATGGVFVLVWMNARRLSRVYRPLWPTVADAQHDLTRLADDENARSRNALDVRVTIIDVSLPTTAPPTRQRHPKPRTKRARVERRRKFR
jgi:hypothetical protein